MVNQELPKMGKDFKILTFCVGCLTQNGQVNPNSKTVVIKKDKVIEMTLNLTQNTIA